MTDMPAPHSIVDGETKMAAKVNNNKTSAQNMTVSVVIANVDTILSVLSNMKTTPISNDVEYTHVVELDVLNFVQSTEDYLTHQATSKIVKADLPVDQSKELLVRLTENMERAKKIYENTPQTTFTRMSVKMQVQLYKQSSSLVDSLQAWYAENLIRSL